MRKNKLLVYAGLIPNRPGGVGIHVRRLMDYLDVHQIPYDFVNYETASLINQIKAIIKSKVVHLHISNPIALFAITSFCCLLGKKAVVTLHGNYGRFSPFKNYLVRQTLRMASVPIVINQLSYDQCKCLNKNIKYIPAFIPPQKEERLQSEIVELIDKVKKSGKRIVSTNAFDVAYDKEGNEIYGIEFLTSFFKESNDYALVVSDASGNYSKKYSENIKNVYFIGYPHPYYELLKRVDIFVRNTSTDGDSLSVKESLSLGLPTLCSDAVDRPDGVIVFNYSEKKSFEEALKQATSLQPIKMDDAAAKIVNIYNEIINNQIH